MNQLFRYKDEIEINKAIWERKGLLRKAYGDFYKKIKENLSSESGQILEIGSGIGAIKEIIPHCVLTDIVYTPYVNFVQSAYRLSIRDRCLSNIILFDVFHHLKFPLIALKEFSRVLKPKGRVIIFEPYISIFGYLVYGLMHKEPVGFNRKIIWNDKESDIKDNCYYSAQGNATRIFHKKELPLDINLWELIRLERLSAISYVLSGGYSGPQLYPIKLYEPVKFLEKILDKIPSLFATRMLVVLEKKFFQD